jgi:hypothetical protein
MKKVFLQILSIFFIYATIEGKGAFEVDGPGQGGQPIRVYKRIAPEDDGKTPKAIPY